MKPTDRLIYQRGGGDQIARLLSSMFAAEVLCPGRRLWLDSPWISNLSVLDSRSDQFASVNPSWSRSAVSLAAALVHLASNGCRVRLITRDDPHNRSFADEISRLATSAGVVVALRFNKRGHAKGLITERAALWGSMNFTENGVNLNDELVEYTTNPEKLAELAAALDDEWKEGDGA